MSRLGEPVGDSPRSDQNDPFGTVPNRLILAQINQSQKDPQSGHGRILEINSQKYALKITSKGGRLMRKSIYLLVALLLIAVVVTGCSKPVRLFRLVPLLLLLIKVNLGTSLSDCCACDIMEITGASF